MRNVLVGLLALSLAACGTPSGAVEVDPALVPFEVGRSPSPTPSPGGQVRTISIYLVREGRLEPVTRTLTTTVGSAQVAMTALLEGPNEVERAAGFGSAIPTVARLLSVTSEGTAERVDLTEEFQGPATPEDVLLRVAQVVWTLVALPEIQAVRFSIDGRPISVPTEAEPAVDRPVTQNDYAGLVLLPSRSGPP